MQKLAKSWNRDFSKFPGQKILMFAFFSLILTLKWDGNNSFSDKFFYPFKYFPIAVVPCVILSFPSTSVVYVFSFFGGIFVNKYMGIKSNFTLILGIAF